MKKKLIAILFLILIVLSGCGKKDDSSSSSAKAGDPEKLFNQKCSICHGDINGSKLETIGSKLSEEDIEKIIREGRGKMPKGVLEGEDAKAVAAWLAEKK
ncbi:c-type cytochrome [Niallia sp. 01092]|uniref:c-type cytochrome n=1 Tax=unclassified Niallia TaxID=2837522 RepID=UPI003FD3EEC1